MSPTLSPTLPPTLPTPRPGDAATAAVLQTLGAQVLVRG